MTEAEAEAVTEDMTGVIATEITTGHH